MEPGQKPTTGHLEAILGQKPTVGHLRSSSPQVQSLPKVRLLADGVDARSAWIASTLQRCLEKLPPSIVSGGPCAVLAIEFVDRAHSSLAEISGAERGLLDSQPVFIRWGSTTLVVHCSKCIEISDTVEAVRLPMPGNGEIEHIVPRGTIDLILP